MGVFGVRPRLTKVPHAIWSFHTQIWKFLQGRAFACSSAFCLFWSFWKCLWDGYMGCRQRQGKGRVRTDYSCQEKHFTQLQWWKKGAFTDAFWGEKAMKYPYFVQKKYLYIS